MFISSSEMGNDFDGLSEEEITKEKTAKNEVKSKAKARKETSRGKREKAGLVEKSIFLEQKDYDRFQALAESLEHKIGAKGLSSEQLSMVIQYLLDFYEQPKGICIPLTADGQYLYRVHRILKHRRNKEQKNSYKQIASFMVESKYSIPKKLSGFNMVIPSKSKYCWSSDLVQILLNAKFINDQILKLNAYSPIDLPTNATGNQQESIVDNSSSGAIEDESFDFPELDEPFEVDESEYPLDDVDEGGIDVKGIREEFEFAMEKIHGRVLDEAEFLSLAKMEKETAFRLYLEAYKKELNENVPDDFFDFDDDTND